MHITILVKTTVGTGTLRFLIMCNGLVQGNSTNPTCPWCPMCQYSNGTSCYNTQLTGQAYLSDGAAGITNRRALQTKKPKQKDKTTKKTLMNCSSAKDKIVSFFQEQGIAKLRAKYSIGKVAKGSDKGGHRERSSRDCNVELQAHLGKDWTIKNLKCTPEDKNKIR